MALGHYTYKREMGHCESLNAILMAGGLVLSFDRDWLRDQEVRSRKTIAPVEAKADAAEEG